ncbi:putative coatomer beta subunit (COPB1), coatomer beta subunit, appendage platform protein [Medicago truncatula]|uniref:Putative coatomer beta subunit (COPB1), coatomer beta subunit, appendage platform protein n=1 Tax=Medicago truncatula TaxID=3880 RepID=A0A396H9N0_MEDTR|nr:putative coatomer beta subunit (COPB1), coatomer beta subunit, appendage platform protein [Medicago truncatula]
MLYNLDFVVYCSVLHWNGKCGFLSANLYAKSVFGEDALANLSIEKQADGKLSGYITVRSKTEGIALSLGDKITLKQNGTTQ